MMSGKFQQMSNSQLRQKIRELEAAGNSVEAGKYKKELSKRGVVNESDCAEEGEKVCEGKFLHNIKQGLSHKYFMGTASFEELKDNMMKTYHAVKMDEDHIDVLISSARNYIAAADAAKYEFPDNAKEIDKFVKWLKTDFLKSVNKEAKRYGYQFSL